MAAQVKAVRFGLLPQDAIENISAVHVTDPTLHHRNSVRADSLLDPRFGATSRFQACGTCGRTLATCPSHPGHMTMPMPVPHVSYKTVLLQLLNVVCCNCSTLLASPAEKQKIVQSGGTKRLMALYNYFRARRQQHAIVCPNPACKWPQPTTELSEPYFVHRWDTALLDALSMDNNESNPITAELLQECYNQTFNNTDVVYLLKSVPHDDLRFLQFNPKHSHPADMMLRFLIVPGANVRPTLHHGDGSKRQTYNELTKVLACIAKYISQINDTCAKTKFDLRRMNNNLLPLETGPGWTAALDGQIKSLYYNVSTYLNPRKADIPDFKARPYDAKLHAMPNSNVLAPLEGGKMGRYRQNIQGKRVNHCARTVVTPFPEGDIDEVRVPKVLADVLCVPERVSKYSIKEQQAKLQRGEYKHVIPDYENAPREVIEINDKNRNYFVLQVGHVVDRALRTGDPLLMNRQPTLHKVSMMAHRAVVMEGKTFGIHTITMPPYNCDCDGDELNAHVVQSLPAVVELEELMAVSNNMLHPGSNRPAVGMIQDGVVAAWALTGPDTWLTKSDIMSLLLHAKYNPHAPPTEPMTSTIIGKQWSADDLPPPAITKPRELWSGKQLLSILLPHNLHLHRHGAVLGTTSSSSHKDELIVAGGQLLTGQLCKRTVGPVAHGLTHYIALYHGYGAACRFLSDLSRVCAAFFARVGFSMGLSDCKPRDPNVQTQFKRMVDDVEQAFESDVRSRVKRMRELAADDVDWQERTTKAYETAAVATVKTALDTTGKVMDLDPKNAVQVMTVEAASKGSSFNSSQIIGCLGQTFVDGGRPTAQMPPGGRCMPSSRLAKQPEDQEKTRRLLQTAGFVARPYSLGLNVEQSAMHAMGGREGLIDTARKTKVTGYLQRRLVKALETLKCAYDCSVRNSRESVFDIRFGGDGYESSRLLQVAKLDLLLADNAHLRRLADATKRALFDYDDLVAVRDRLRSHRVHGLQQTVALGAALPFCLDTLIPPQANVVTLMCKCYSPAEPVDDELRAAYRAFVMQTVETPCAAHVMWYTGHKCRYCNTCLAMLLEDMIRLHERALLQPGDSIGALAATSLGEPATQLTLNTFHFSGTSNDGMTYGVPRMCEIIDAKVDINSPRMWLPLVAGTTRDEAQQVAASLIETGLLACLTESGIVDGLPPSARASNPCLLDDHLTMFLRYAVRFVFAARVNMTCAVHQLQRAVSNTGLVLTDATAPQTAYVLLVRDEKELSKAVAKATSGHANRANKRHARPMQLNTDDPAAAIDVPLHVLCSTMAGTRPAGTRSAGARPVTVQELLEANQARELMARLHATCIVGGTPGVRDAVVRTHGYSVVDPKTGAVTTEERLLLDVRGTILESVHLVPHVDLANVVTNNVHEVYRLLGVDAAERVLFHEIRTCFEVGGARPDDRLIALLTSVITHWGIILPINRYGLNRLADQSVIAKICFEEVVEQVLTAAAHGTFDPLLGPSETIMFGKLVNSGTGMPVMICNTDDGDDDTIVISVLPECPWYVAPNVQKLRATKELLAEKLPIGALIAAICEFRPSSPPDETAEEEFRPSSPFADGA
jgi:DNA-directed RNA polymerase II subunit RPB1